MPSTVTSEPSVGVVRAGVVDDHESVRLGLDDDDATRVDLWLELDRPAVAAAG